MATYVGTPTEITDAAGNVLWQRPGLMAERVTRAQAILTQCLPRFVNREQAIDNLYYADPEASPEITLYSIAAALYVLGVHPSPPTPGSRTA